MRLVRQALLLFMILSGSISACGGEEEVTVEQPLTIEEYVQKVVELQEQSRTEFNAASEALPPYSDNPSDSLARYHALAIQQGNRFFESINSFSPPVQIVNAHLAFVEAWPPYRLHLERTRDLWANAETIEDVGDEITAEKDAIARNPFEDACIEVENAAREADVGADLSCDVDWFFGGGKVVTGGCILLPPDPTSSEESECPEEFGGDFRGRTRLAEMPPLPSGLVAVTDFYETVRQPTDSSDLGVGLPLRQPVDDPSSLGLYTYSDGTWKRISDVTVRDIGSIVAEFTFQSAYPENYAVLQATR